MEAQRKAMEEKAAPVRADLEAKKDSVLAAHEAYRKSIEVKRDSVLATHKEMVDSLKALMQSKRDSIMAIEIDRREEIKSYNDSLKAAFELKKDSLIAVYNEQRTQDSIKLADLKQKMETFRKSLEEKKSFAAPNPVKTEGGILNIENETNETLKLYIYNFNGKIEVQEEFQGESTTIPELRPGMYYYKIANDKGVIISHGKFFVE